MKFELIDKIESLSSGRIVGWKYVSLAEEYLADHFPTFPVLPGVLMLEVATQAAVWLLHHRRGFACSMAVLSEARNVKYGYFVAPGNSLRVEVEWVKDTETGATFKVSGTVGDDQAITARIGLSYFNLADKNNDLSGIDVRLKAHHQTRWAVISAGRPGIGALEV